MNSKINLNYVRQRITEKDEPYKKVFEITNKTLQRVIYAIYYLILFIC